MASGDIWRENRRFAQKSLRDAGFGKKLTEEYILEESKMMVNYLNKKIDNEGMKLWDNQEELFEMMALNIIWQMVAGERYNYEDEDKQEILNQLRTFIKFCGNVIAGPINAFPILR